jgi:periplasmic divalent cation tolerance protein
MNFVLIYITNPTKQEAKRIANYLLKKRLIACGNIFPIESLYWWKNKIVNGKEFVLVAKTIKTNFEKVKTEIEKIHSYTIPCIIKIPVSSNKEYFDWLKGEIKK